MIVGGGFAALEAALALRALAGQQVKLTLITSRSAFPYRPTATIEAFRETAPQSYDLRNIAADLDATFRKTMLQAVLARDQLVQLEPGGTRGYDYLILATGARTLSAVSGAFTFRDQRDIPHFRVILDELAAGHLRRLVFAVPSSHCWSLPAYELALLSSLRAVRHRVAAEISLVTPEAKPLAVFGDHASRPVAELLAERKIRFLGNSFPHRVGPDGSLSLHFDASMAADRVIAVPELHAVRIPGIPGTWSGFVPTDPSGRVEGVANVYAAGDVTAFPIKQGGLAAQQADRVAHAIAGELGIELKQDREPHILRARLLTGDGALVLRTELDPLGRPVGPGLEHRESRQAEDLKVFGRYLTPYLATYAARAQRGTAAV